MIPNYRFSVLMCVYKNDSADLFELAIDSIFKNTLNPSQVVIVVDGFIGDELKSILNSYKLMYANLLDVYYLPKNIGFAHALNYGLKKVVNEWVIRADADDYNLPDRFETLIRKIKKNDNIDLIGSYILEIGGHTSKVVRSVPLEFSAIKKSSYRRNPFNHMSVAFRKSVVLDVGGYPNLHLHEDYGLWCLLIRKNCNCINIPNILVHANTGDSFYKRRGGIKYLIAEINFQKFIYKNCSKSLFLVFLDLLIRGIIFLSPTFFRKFFYLFFLRKNY